MTLLAAVPGAEAGSYKKIALGASALLHGALIVVILLTANLERKPVVEPPRSIDLVSVEELLPPVEPPKAPPLVAAPSPSLAATPTQAAAAPREEAPAAPAAPTPGLSAEELGPPAADGSGMSANVGNPAAPPSAAPSPAPSTSPSAGTEPDYLPQFKITELPVVPVKDVLAKIEYPPLAAKQGIEATVYLELLIDDTGKIRKITVLKDPGYGFAEAAVAALSGLVCGPAKVEGRAVAVRYRYPVRFALK
jgi:TonB family protein